MESELLSITAAAQYTGVSVCGLRRYRSLDIGPQSFKLNGRVVYERCALDRWLADQRALTLRGGQVTSRCAAAS